MPGLLEKFGPTLQGIGGALAVGANPLLGLLAGPGIKASRDRRALENEALRGGVDQQRRIAEAQDQLQGLLARTTKQPDRQIPLERLDGPPTTTTIQGRFEPTVSTPEGQRELLGLLGTIAPQQAATGLLSRDQRAAPADIRTMQSLGIPLTPEGFKAFNELKGDDIDSLTGRLDAEIKLLQLQRETAEEKERLKDEVQDKQRFANSVNRNLSNIDNLASLNRNLQGTFLETGLPLSDIRRATQAGAAGIGQLLGADTKEASKALADFDKLNKGLNDLVIETMDRFGNNLTNDKLTLLQNASANVNIAPEAIASILANVAEIYLEQADLNDVKVPNRTDFEALITRERNFSGPTRRLKFNIETGKVE